MEHLKEGLRNDIKKLTSSTHRILSDMDGMNSIDIDILLESTRRFYERAVELREVFQVKKKMLSDSDEVITMPFISGEEYREEIQIQDEIEVQPEIKEIADTKENKEEVIEKEPVFIQKPVEEIIDVTHSPVQLEEDIVEENNVDDEIVVEQIPEENIIVTEEKNIPFEVNQITPDNNQQTPYLEEIPIIEERDITDDKTLQTEPLTAGSHQQTTRLEEVMLKPEEGIIVEEKPRPELFNYLNTKTAGARQSELFGMESNASTTVGERFQQTHTRSILDQLSSSSANNGNVAGRANQAVIEDIRQVIGINEKFLFINELFGGNMREYNDFILSLNDIQSTDEAQQYLDSVRERKDWDTQSLAYVSFLKIFERKFI